MAKIFSNIARNAPNLVKRYDDSTVTNELTTFNALRNLGGAPTLFISNAPKSVYDLYTDPSTISTPLLRTIRPSSSTLAAQGALLVTPTTVVRIRRSKFYDAFPIVNANFTALNVPVNDTLVEIKPYSQVNNDEIYSVETSRMLRDDRTNPLVSGPRDVVRMNRYLSSAEGLLFKLNQQILQSGNTFGQSQGYNPASVETMVLNYRNATLFNPLERIPRILVGNAIVDSQLQGRLQKETVLNSQSKLRLKFVGGAAVSPQSPINNAINSLLGGIFRDRINNVNIPVPGFVRNLANFANDRFNTNFTPGTSINVGQVSRQLDTIAAGAEAIRRGLNTNNSTLEPDQTAYDELYLKNLWPLMKENDGTIKNFQGPQGTREQYLQRARQLIRKGSDINRVNQNTNEYPQDDYRSSATYTEDVRFTGTKRTKDGLTTATYIKDTMNLRGQNIDGRTVQVGITDSKYLDGLSEGNIFAARDYITFKIMVPGIFSSGVSFRAFIEDINHSSRGQYDEVRYVGRPERFITYKGMNRSVTFGMYLVAFSEEELDTIWTRADMLNRLTFPIGDAGGFMTPPISRLTIGNIFVDQPGYVENVDMRLQDIPWDIDKELPQAIKLNLTFNIIEDNFPTQNTANKIFGIRNKQTEVVQNPNSPGVAAAAGDRDASPAGAARASAGATAATAPTATTKVTGSPPFAQSQPRPSTLGSLGDPNLNFGQLNITPPRPEFLQSATRPVYTPGSSLLERSQAAFGQSAAAVSLNNTFRNLGRAVFAGPTIGPRP